jgi:hypothetical protein
MEEGCAQCGHMCYADSDTCQVRRAPMQQLGPIQCRQELETLLLSPTMDLGNLFWLGDVKQRRLH